MKKKTILLLAFLALMVMPVTAMAAAEFSLGGFVKMEGDWDSTQMNKNITSAVLRNNNPNFHHGRLKMTAEGSRFNFTVKGPKLWGAQVTGLIEVDFDTNFGQGPFTAAPLTLSASNNYVPRLRHAMFRLNWPETELMFGQYWGMLSEFTPEGVQDGSLQFRGAPNQRAPQVRLTQQFLGAWTVAVAILKPYDSQEVTPDIAALTPAIAPGVNANIAPAFRGDTHNAASSETPQVQGKLAYEKDLWGKAAFYGRPRGFVAQIAAAWQRTRYRGAAFAGASSFLAHMSQNGFAIVGNSDIRDQNYLDPWIVQGTLFIPVIPTHTANLAGTMSLQAQWYIGQGVALVGEGRDQDNSYFQFQNVNALGRDQYERKLTKRYGGYVQMQYYFTNEWFVSTAWGMTKAFGINNSTILPGVPVSKYATIFDQTKFWMEWDLALWYRPIQALKFGVQYSYARTDWLQKAGSNVVVDAGRITDIGENHRVMFAGFFYF